MSDLDERLVFVISPPRSGSTMLVRILASHSAIYGRPEPQAIAPLFQLGFYGRVADAGSREGTIAFHPELAHKAIRHIVAELPRGEDDYLDAIRAYLDVLYGRLLAKSGKALFVDKTPRNALYVDFIARLFPRARFVILVRNPLAVASSMRTIMGTGIHPGIPIYDSQQPVFRELTAFVRTVADCIRRRPVASHLVRYEALVASPASEVSEICTFLGVAYEPVMIEYGAHGQRWEGPGDPVLVNERTRPTDEPLDKWKHGVREDPAQAEFARHALASLSDADLAAWGYARDELERDIAEAVRSDARNLLG